MCRRDDRLEEQISVILVRAAIHTQDLGRGDVICGELLVGSSICAQWERLLVDEQLGQRLLCKMCDWHGERWLNAQGPGHARGRKRSRKSLQHLYIILVLTQQRQLHKSALFTLRGL